MNGLRYDREIRWLFQAAMLLFLVTIGIGMARGLGLIDFDNRNNFLTHLHSGVIGWITLSIFAAALWLYGGTDARKADEGLLPWTTILLVVAVPLYVVAWWTGNLPFRAIAGAGVLLGIVLFVGWLVAAAWRIGYRGLTTPRLGTVLGLVSLVVGSTIGVLLQIQLASGAGFLPESATGAHAETQISAYLLLVAMSIAYWRLHGDDRTARGTWMVWLFFVAGVIIAVALLANVLPLTALYIPLDIAAFVLLLSVAWGRIVRPGWMAAGSARHYAIAIPFGIVYLAIFIYLVAGFALFQLWPTFDDVPPNLIPSSEHPLFVGMVTNTIFGLLIDLNRDRRSIWPWADGVVFWGMNVAVAAFTAALLFNADGTVGFITPVLGLSLLLGLLTHTRRLWAGGEATPVAAQARGR